MPSSQQPPSLTSPSSSDQSSGSPILPLDAMNPTTTTATAATTATIDDRDEVRSTSAAPTNASSSRHAASDASSGGDREKSRLTEQEKKNNHIASEQKRRAAIREGFDRLTELVPGLEGQGRSESIVLKKTVDFIQLQLQERHALVAEIERNGGQIENNLRPS